MRSESQLKQALDQILAKLPVQGEEQQQEQDVAPLVASGRGDSGNR